MPTDPRTWTRFDADSVNALLRDLATAGRPAPPRQLPRECYRCGETTERWTAWDGHALCPRCLEAVETEARR